MRNSSIILVGLWLTSTCIAQEIEQMIDPGVGRHPNEGQTYMEVVETNDGFAVEYFIAPESTGFSPSSSGLVTLVTTWVSDSWTKLTVDKTEVRAAEQFELTLDGGVFIVDFNPYQTIPGVGLPQPLEGLILEPSQYDFSLVPIWS